MTAAARRIIKWESVLAALFMFGLLVHVPGFSLAPASVLLSVALLPVVFSNLPREARRIGVWTLAAVVSGLLMMLTSVGTGLAAPGAWETFTVLVWILSIPLTVALAIWSLRRVSLRSGVLLMLGGAVLSDVAIALLARGELEWKGTLGIFVTAFLLVLFAGKWFWSALALLVVTAASALNDARSMMVVGLAALIVLLVQRPRRRQSHWIARTLRVVVGLAGVAVAGLWAITQGLGGAELQQRTVNQLNGVNPLFSARAEWASTLDLASTHPFGFGVGVVPDASAIYSAITAVQAAGGDYRSTYFSDVVFGARVDLHSTTSNLWFHFGIGGLALVVALALILARGIRDCESISTTLGIGAIYMMLMASWDLFFSPMANVDRLIAGVIIAIVASIEYGRRAGSESSPPAQLGKPMYSNAM